METIPSVTAVIPAYNAERLIARCLDSILAQTVPVAEIIVIDDGSTDQTLAVASAYPHPVRCFTRENLGLSHARNTGIRAARTEWIAFLDADDTWKPAKIERQLLAAEQHPEAGVFYTDASVTTPEGAVLGRYLEGKDAATGWVFDRLLSSVFALPSTLMIRRSTLMEAGLFREDLKRAEDYDLLLRLARLSQFQLVPEELTLYERQENSLSRNSREMSLAEVSILDSLMRRGLTPTQLRSVRRRLATNFFELAYASRHTDRQKSLHWAWRSIKTYPYASRNWTMLAKSAARFLIHPVPAAGGIIRKI